MDSAKSTGADELDQLAREVLFDDSALPVLIDALIERGVLREAPICLRLAPVLPHVLCRSCGLSRPDYRGAEYCRRWIEAPGQRLGSAGRDGSEQRDVQRLRIEALRWAHGRHDLLYETVRQLVHKGVVIEGVSRSHDGRS